MNPLDREVYTVILGLVVLASIASAIMYVNPYKPKPYTLLALLDEDCRIGDYPRIVFNNTEVKLCLYVENHLGYPALFRIDYRIDTSRPENGHVDVDAPLIDSIHVFLNDGGNESIHYTAKIYSPSRVAGRVYLVFELWYMDPGNASWRYTGRTVYLGVEVIENPLG